MLNKVVVALDDSPWAERVIAALGQLHLLPASEVLLVQVVSPLADLGDPHPDRPHPVIEPGDREERLQVFQNQLPPCRSSFMVVTGDPAEEIVRLAASGGADLVIIGCRGLQGVDRILANSVSSQVCETAPCSVLIVKS